MEWQWFFNNLLEIETAQQEHGAGSPRHKIALIVLDKCTVGFKFIAMYGKPESRLAWNFTWNGSLIEEANFAFWVNKQYTDFMHIFPLWHKNHDEAELISDESVRFYLPNDSKR